LADVPAATAGTNTEALLDVSHRSLQFWSSVDDVVYQHLVSDLSDHAIPRRLTTTRSDLCRGK
jgi:hypothetical protein